STADVSYGRVMPCHRSFRSSPFVRPLCCIKSILLATGGYAQCRQCALAHWSESDQQRGDFLQPAIGFSERVSLVTAAPQTPFQIAPSVDSQQRVLTPEAIQFLIRLSKEFEPRRQALMLARRARQQAIDDGWQPDFIPATAEIRDSSWEVAEI